MLPPNVDDIYPLTPMQRLMLLHAIGTGGNGVLFNQVSYEIRGALDVEAFRQAWESLVARHPALRTAFLWEGLAQPLQAVRSSVTVPYRSVDLTDLPEDERIRASEALRREDAEEPVVLGKAPLMRLTLARVGDQHYRFFWAVHHLVVDRWSHALLFADLRALYAAHSVGVPPKLEEPPPFRQYLTWIAEQDRAGAEQFWRSELTGLTEPSDLAGDGRSPGCGDRLTSRRLFLPETAAAVRASATRWRTTPAAILLASVGLLMARLTGRDDVVCGVTVSGRPPEFESAGQTVGSFMNNLPARIKVARAQPIGEWVRAVQRGQLSRQAFAHVSPSDIQDWSQVAPGRALFDTLVLLNLTDESQLAWPGIALIPEVATLDASYPLLLAITTVGDQLETTLIHDEDFEPSDELLSDFEATVRAIAIAADAAVVGDLVPPATAPPNPVAFAPAPGIGDVAPVAVGAIAESLLHAWREVLGNGVGLDDDFFAVGGTSLQAAQLFARIERIIGKSLPLSTLFEAGSVRALLEKIDRPLARNRSLVRIRSSGKRPPLYVIPGIGGNIVGLAGLVRHLGADQPVSAFESPGLDGREEPLTSIEEVAERYVGELLEQEAGDFHLLGLCFGAAVAFEMAQRLRERGRAPASLLLMDPAVLLRDASAQSTGDSVVLGRLELYWDEFRSGSWSDRGRMLATKARRAVRVLTDREVRAQTQSGLNQNRVVAANTAAVTRFQPGRYHGPAGVLLTSDREIGGGPDPRLEWLSLVDPEPAVEIVGGATSGEALLALHVAGFAAAVRRRLDAAQRGP